jgi:hypothetical protein
MSPVGLAVIIFNGLGHRAGPRVKWFNNHKEWVLALYSAQAYTDLDLAEKKIVAKQFGNCRFNGCNFSKVEFKNCKFTV